MGNGVRLGGFGQAGRNARLDGNIDQSLQQINGVQGMRVDVSDLTQTDNVEVAASRGAGRGGIRTVGSRPINFGNAGTGNGFLVANGGNAIAGRTGQFGGSRGNGARLVGGQAARRAGGVDNAGQQFRGQGGQGGGRVIGGGANGFAATGA